MVDCQKAVDALLDYLEDNVPPHLKQRMLKHFEDCPPCLDFLETYKKTSRLCRKTLMKQAPEGFSARLQAFLRERTKPESD